MASLPQGSLAEGGIFKGTGPKSYGGYSGPTSLEARFTGWVTPLLGGE